MFDLWGQGNRLAGNDRWRFIIQEHDDYRNGLSVRGAGPIID
jgi:hypothetical protein